MLIKNAVQTPDGTILRSYTVHDYVVHIDKNGETYFVDGGLEYVHMSNNKEPATSLFVYHDDPFEIVREVDWWGSYGKSGKEELKQMALKDMEYSHIEAILETQFHLSFERLYLFEKELEYRRKYG